MPVTAPADATAGHGLLVAVEGGDGAGKSTQLRLLGRWLAGRVPEVVLTREPGGTAVGAAIREVLLHGAHVAPRAEALLFAADRAHHVDTLVRPALERGAVVLTDRFMDSSIAYQAAARGLDRDEVRDLSLWATGGLVPDLTVLLDVDPATGRSRRGRVHDRLESEGDDFHDRVRRGYLALAGAEPGRYLVLPAGAPPEVLHRQVVARLLRLSSDLEAGQPELGTVP